MAPPGQAGDTCGPYGSHRGPWALRRAPSNMDLPTDRPRDPRAARFTMALALRYRHVGETVWRQGVTENVSRSDILFQANDDLPLFADLAHVLNPRADLTAASRSKRRSSVKPSAQSATSTSTACRGTPRAITAMPPMIMAGAPSAA